MDQSKKTMRHFYCRDVLWETFEQMANDFDCSIDYLVNEAMRYYARSKNYQSPGPPGAMTGAAPVAGNSSATAFPKGNPRSISSTAPPPNNPNTALPTSAPAGGRGRGAPPPPGHDRGGGPAMHAAGTRTAPGRAPPPHT